MESPNASIVCCIVCSVREVSIYPHRNENNDVCGIIFLCANHAKVYAGGEFTLKPERDNPCPKTPGGTMEYKITDKSLAAAKAIFERLIKRVERDMAAALDALLMPLEAGAQARTLVLDKEVEGGIL